MDLHLIRMSFIEDMINDPDTANTVLKELVLTGDSPALNKLAEQINEWREQFGYEYDAESIIHRAVLAMTEQELLMFTLKRNYSNEYWNGLVESAIDAKQNFLDNKHK